MNDRSGLHTYHTLSDIEQIIARDVDGECSDGAAIIRKDVDEMVARLTEMYYIVAGEDRIVPPDTFEARIWYVLRAFGVAELSGEEELLRLALTPYCPCAELYIAL